MSRSQMIFPVAVFVWLIVASTACATPVSSAKILAVETFLADIAQNVAGERARVDALLPIGVDPHSFEPTPQDVRRVADSTVLIVNGADFEEFLDELLKNAGGNHQVIEASAGLTSRKPTETEIVDPDHKTDPHFWFDPNLVVKYVENIRDGLSQTDPAGAAVYAANANAYIAKLKELDQFIAEQVRTLPAERRLMVTDHDTFGYFADRYGFRVVGMIVPSISTGASPSAQEIAQLVQQIKATQARAIFLEAGTNPQLAQQIAKETGVKVVTGLQSHSITEQNGPAPTYIEMMKYNLKLIVEALK